MKEGLSQRKALLLMQRFPKQMRLGTLSKKKNDIIWEFFPNVGQSIVRSADEKYKTNCRIYSAFNNQLDLISIQSEDRGHFSYLLLLTFSV